MPGNIAQFFTRHLARPDLSLYRHFVRRRVARRHRRRSRRARRPLAGGVSARGPRRRRSHRACACATASTGSRSTWRRSGMGLVVVPLYVDDNADNVAWCVGNAEARAARRRELAHGRGAREMRRCRAGAAAHRRAAPRRRRVGGGAGDAFCPRPPRNSRSRNLPDDTLATICYTSGTSGPAEGRDAVARQHHRQRRAMRGDPHGAAGPTCSCRSCRCRTCSSAPAATTCRCRSAPRWRTRAVSRRSPTTSHRRRRRSCSRCRASSSASARASTSRSQSRRRRSGSSTPASTRGFRAATGNAGVLDRLLVPPICAGSSRKPVLARLGGRLRLAVVGGAALDPALAHAFIGLGTSDAAGLRHDRGLAGHLGEPRRRQRARIRRTAAAGRRGYA